LYHTSGFVVVDKYRGGDVHGVDQDQAFFDPALLDALSNIGGDVYKRPKLKHKFSFGQEYLYFWSLAGAAGNSDMIHSAE